MHERILLLSSANKNRGRFLNILGDICLGHWKAAHMRDGLDQAVSTYDDAVQDGLADTSFLHDLGVGLLHRAKQFNDVGDIARAVSVMEDVVQFTTDGHPDKPSMLNNLAAGLHYRFKHFGDLADLKRTVSLAEDVVHLTPEGHPDRPAWLNNLSTALYSCFQHLGDLADLTKSVSIREDAVCLAPEGHPDRLLRLIDLGAALRRRFEHLGNLVDLDKSVLMTENAIHLAPEGHPGKQGALTNLVGALNCRFEHLGELTDLNKSILMAEDGVRLTPEGHPEKPFLLQNLGIAFHHRFEHFGDLDDLNKSLLMAEDAVRLTPEGHPDKTSMLSNLGDALRTRFEHLGDLAALNKSVLIGEDAVRLTPDGHPRKAARLHNLGAALRCRFECLGNLADLNKSVLMRENAVCLTPEGHPDKPSMLSNLGGTLLRRFEHLGDLADLNKSVSMREDAVRMTPEGHPDKPLWLNSLGSVLRFRFERLSELADLNRSVSIGENAVSLTPDGHTSKPAMLNNLAVALHRRFICFHELDDLNKSVLMGEDAICLTPEGHPSKPPMLQNLSGALCSRFEHLGDLADLNKSVFIAEDAVRLMPEGHPDKPLLWYNLGRVLFHRFEHSDDSVNLKKAIHHYTSAACSTTGLMTIRFEAALRWAHLAKMTDELVVLEAYQIALNLLPDLAWLGLSISDRHYQLLKAGKIVRDAAAVAIASGQAEKAVEWLEQGRSIIWGQLLDLRTPMDTLKNSYPELAHRLHALSARLEGSGTRVIHPESESNTQQSLQSVANQAHQDAYERKELLKQIRELEGFSRFLLPRTISELSQAAQQGAVVILNISAERCDALILMPHHNDEVIHISLPDFTPGDAESLAESHRHLVGRGKRLTGTREGVLNPDNEFEQNLAKLWLKVVKPVLDGLAITTPRKTKLPRIWWCPTGPLAFLPIHAAGLYGKNEPWGSKLSDFVISSYTPSLTALIEGFRIPSESQKEPQLLAVAQPFATGQYPIPGTQDEISHIERLADGKLPILRLEEHMATLDNVQQGMKDSRWVHFACHGVQNVAHPTESALLLAGDSRLTLSNIIQLALPNADLAFLSACQTATGDKSLEEESVHLAAGMLLAGYRGVIATMWTIMDNDAPQVASDVYEHLFQISPPDPMRAAEALHLAVQKLRESGRGGKKSFFHWVPFIHIGV
ncbi:TPR-like protein [Mycena epipterygia]|nr:TPR-like protein [Mycena epipterygia]